MLTTVAETREYLRSAGRLLSTVERAEKANLSKSERNELSSLVAALKFGREH